MIKRIIACLTICLIVTGLISPVFSNASALPQPNWSDPGISEIINISDLTGWMLNGGTFDVSTYTDAESFMNDYYNSRTRTRLISPSEDPQDDYYEVLPGFGINNQFVAGESFARPLETNRVIASSFRDHTGYGRRLSNEVNNALLSSGSLYDTKIPLLNEVEFANFVGYNHDALKLYSEFFNNDDPSPGPNPPSEYQFFIDQLTNSNVNNINLNSATPGIGSSYHCGFSFDRPVSWYCMNPTSATDWNNCRVAPLNVSTIYIDSDNYRHKVQYFINSTDSISISSAGYIYRLNNSDNSIAERFRVGLLYGSLSPDIYFMQYSDSIYIPSTTEFDSMTLCLNYLVKYFKYVNVYVDDVPWGIVGNSSNLSNITPEFPDAVGGEELETTTWPISRPRAPYYTNVPGVLQAIEDAIADDGELDIDDLKPYLTDANGDPVPDPIFDPEPVPLPVPDPVNPDVIPGLPVLPAIPPDMPGFNGVSVLAEIINFTNQSLPTALIVTFWGIVFGIVILGLIKILHK